MVLRDLLPESLAFTIQFYTNPPMVCSDRGNMLMGTFDWDGHRLTMHRQEMECLDERVDSYYYDMSKRILNVFVQSEWANSEEEFNQMMKENN